jgi:hypothetical protein
MGNIQKPFQQLSPLERAELYRAAGNVRSCDSCVAWLPVNVNIAGRIRVEMDCVKKMPACQPNNGRVCDFYERAVGADDE